MNGNNKIGKLGAVALAALAVVLPANITLADEHSLINSMQSVDVAGAVGGTAVFANHWEQPTGTGVFQPFLTIDANGQTSTGNRNIEQGYNTDGHENLYLDQHRPEWNNLLRVSDLATISMNGVNYFAFILDANEPGNGNSLLSIDNIRIYTSSTDTTGNVGDDADLLDNLGTLRWAMNTPLSSGPPDDIHGFNVDQWVSIDAAQETVGHGNANGGSGQGDMVVYIPQSAFGNSVGTDDYLWFYNLNGVHYEQNGSFGSTAGFEEWRAVTGPQNVPDNGGTFALFGSAIIALGLLARRQSCKKA